MALSQQPTKTVENPVESIVNDDHILRALVQTKNPRFLQNQTRAAKVVRHAQKTHVRYVKRYKNVGIIQDVANKLSDLKKQLSQDAADAAAAAAAAASQQFTKRISVLENLLETQQREADAKVCRNREGDAEKTVAINQQKVVLLRELENLRLQIAQEQEMMRSLQVQEMKKKKRQQQQQQQQTPTSTAAESTSLSSNTNQLKANSATLIGILNTRAFFDKRSGAITTTTTTVREGGSGTSSPTPRDEQVSRTRGSLLQILDDSLGKGASTSSEDELSSSHYSSTRLQVATKSAKAVLEFRNLLVELHILYKSELDSQKNLSYQEEYNNIEKELTDSLSDSYRENKGGLAAKEASSVPVLDETTSSSLTLGRYNDLYQRYAKMKRFLSREKLLSRDRTNTELQARTFFRGGNTKIFTVPAKLLLNNTSIKYLQADGKKLADLEHLNTDSSLADILFALSYGFEFTLSYDQVSNSYQITKGSSVVEKVDEESGRLSILHAMVSSVLTNNCPLMTEMSSSSDDGITSVYGVFSSESGIPGSSIRQLITSYESSIHSKLEVRFVLGGVDFSSAATTDVRSISLKLSNYITTQLHPVHKDKFLYNTSEMISGAADGHRRGTGQAIVIGETAGLFTIILIPHWDGKVRDQGTLPTINDMRSNYLEDKASFETANFQHRIIEAAADPEKSTSILKVFLGAVRRNKVVGYKDNKKIRLAPTFV